MEESRLLSAIGDARYSLRDRRKKGKGTWEKVPREKGSKIWIKGGSYSRLPLPSLPNPLAFPFLPILSLCLFFPTHDNQNLKSTLGCLWTGWAKARNMDYAGRGKRRGRLPRHLRRSPWMPLTGYALNRIAVITNAVPQLSIVQGQSFRKDTRALVFARIVVHDDSQGKCEGIGAWPDRFVLAPISLCFEIKNGDCTQEIFNARKNKGSINQPRRKSSFAEEAGGGGKGNKKRNSLPSPPFLSTHPTFLSRWETSHPR